MTFLRRISSLFIILFVILSCNLICFAVSDGYESYDVMNVFSDYYDPWGNNVYRNRAFASIGPDGWIKIPQLDFTDGIGAVELMIATVPEHLGSIEVYVDSIDGECIGSVPIVCSNDWNNPVKSYGRLVSNIEGVHDIYFKYITATCNFFSFQFFPKAANPVNFIYEGSVNYSDASNTEYREDIALMTQLGLYDIFTQGTLELYEPVTRGEFAHILSTLVCRYDDGGESAFSDIEDSDYKNDINTLYSMGVIADSADKKYNPNEFMKLDDAVTMAYQLLGYDLLPEKIAKQEKYTAQKSLVSGIDVTYVLNRGTLARFIHNLLSLNYVSPDYVKNDYPYYNIFKDGILSATKGIKYSYGIVTANSNTQLYSAVSDLAFGNIAIDGKRYNTNNNVLDNLLGYGVEYYYKDDVCYAAIVDKKTEAETISTKDSDIKKIDFDKIVYTQNKKDKTIKISKNTAVIYNGKAVDFDFSEELSKRPYKGTIRLIKNKKGNDVIIFDEYENIVIDAKSDTRISDRLDTSKKYDFTNNTKYAIFSENMSCLMREFNSGDVVLVYESKNKTGEKLLSFVKSNNEIRGLVTEIDNDDYYIDNTKCKVASEANLNITAGQSGVFYLNSFGEIVKFTPEDSELSVGYFVDYKSKDKNFEKGGMIKIYNDSSKEEILTWEDRVIIDGERYTEPEKFMDKMSLLEKDTLICYKKDGDGKLTLIDTYITVKGGANDKLRKLNNTVVSGTYYNRINYVSGGRTKYIIPNNSKMFIKWSIGVDELITCDKNTDWLPNNQTSSIDVYNMDPSTQIASLVVWKGRQIQYNDDIMIFEQKSKRVNADGDVVDYIGGYVNGKYVSYDINEAWYDQNANAKKTINELAEGDIFAYKLYNSEIVSCEVIYFADGSASKNGVNAVLGTTGFWGYGGQDFNCIRGTVAARDGDYLVINEKNSTEQSYIATASVKTSRIKNNGGTYTTLANVGSDSVAVGDEIIVLYIYSKVDDIIIINN